MPPDRGPQRARHRSRASSPATAFAAGSGGLTAGPARNAPRATPSDTWAAFVAMTDEETGLPADSLRADGTASVQTSTTNIGAYMWSTVVAERLGIIDHDEAVARLDETLESLETMERHRAERPVLQLVRPPRPARSSPSGRRPATRSSPILSSVDNGWLATAMQVVANTVPEVAERARSPVRQHGLRVLLPARRQPDRRSTTRPSTGAVAVLLRHDRQREPDRQLHRDRHGRAAGARSTSAPGGPSRTPATGTGTRRGRSASRGRTSGSTSSRAPTRTRTSASCPGWGGSMFEALMPAAVRSRRAVGPAELGGQPPADGRRPDPPRPRRGRVRLLGLLAGEHPRRRLPRVRRRRDRA